MYARLSSGRNPAFLATTIAFFAYTGIFMQKPLLPLYASGLGASVSVVGLIATTQALATVLSSVPLGLYSDVIGRKRLVTLGLLLVAASAFGFSKSTSVTQLIVFSALAGIGGGAYEPSINAYIADIARSRLAGRAFGTFTSAVQAGFVAGPALGGYLAVLAGYQGSFTFAAAVLLLAGSLALTLQSVSESREAKGFRSIAGTTFRSRNVLVGLQSTLITFVIIGALYTFFPLYAGGTGLDVFAIGVILSIHSAMSIFTRPMLGILSDRFSTKTGLVLIGMISGSVSMGLIGLTAGFFNLLVVMIAIAFGLDLAIPLSIAVIAEGSDATNRGFAMGVMSGLRYVGQAAGQSSLGLLASASGFRLGFVSVGAACALGTALVYSIERGQREVKPTLQTDLSAISRESSSSVTDASDSAVRTKFRS